MPRKWSAEAREKARQRALKNKPWIYSTGPRTPEGKMRSSQNSYKHGLRSRYFQALFRYTSAFDRYKKELVKGTDKSVWLTPPQIPKELIEASFGVWDLCESQGLGEDS